MRSQAANSFFGSGKSHYAILARSLLRDIERGRYPVGSLLPTEEQLAEQHGLSRHTVREAIRKLQDAGLISRRKGVGTRVKSNTITARYAHSCASISDLFHYANEVKLVVGPAVEVKTDAMLADTLRCGKGQIWLKYEGLRHARGSAVPICYTDLYVHGEFASIREQIRRSPGPVYALIEKHFAEKVHEVRQEFRAVSIPARVAQRLGVRPGTAGLSIARHYMSADDRVLEVALNLYPADRFSYSMRLRLGTTAGGQHG